MSCICAWPSPWLPRWAKAFATGATRSVAMTRLVIQRSIKEAYPRRGPTKPRANAAAGPFCLSGPRCLWRKRQTGSTTFIDIVDSLARFSIAVVHDHPTGLVPLCLPAVASAASVLLKSHRSCGILIRVHGIRGQPAFQTVAIGSFLLTQDEAGLFTVAAAFALCIPSYSVAIRDLFSAAEACHRPC